MVGDRKETQKTSNDVSLIGKKTLEIFIPLKGEGNVVNRHFPSRQRDLMVSSMMRTINANVASFYYSVVLPLSWLIL